MTTASEEIEKLRSVVSEHFKVYGVVVTPLSLAFQVAPPDGPIDAPFDALRLKLVPKDYIPFIARDHGELLIHVQRRPLQRFASIRVNVTLLLFTVLSTVLFGGAWNWSEYAGVPLLSAEALLYGTVFFTIPLLAILGFHEMGHFVVARRYHVKASLPFLLPSAPPLGTFGAFISMRDPLPSRRALLDIGASGPLVGFAIAIPVTIAGLFLTSISPHAGPLAGGELGLPQPSLFYWFLSLFFPLPANTTLHPLAFAGWVGLFVTAINLLPAGQLDGGHIARALLGSRQHYVSWAAVLLLFFLGFGLGYLGWVLFGVLILMLGFRHPPPLNDLTRLSGSRTLIGFAAVAVLIATFIPQPFAFVSVPHGIQFENAAGVPITNLSVTALDASTTEFIFYLNESTVTPETVTLSIDPKNLDTAGFNLTFTEIIIDGNTTAVNATTATLVFEASARAEVRLAVAVPPTLPQVPSTWTFDVIANVAATDESLTLSISVLVT
ncbi:MAG TPA: site-2 protease family protein [Thermoplasmata archaeon]